MNGYTVLSDLSKSLIQFLARHMVPEPVLREEEIGICRPGDVGNLKLGLFPYHVKVNETNRNLPLRRMEQGMAQFPPLYVDIYVLVSAYGKGEVPDRHFEEQLILGRVLQVFHDNQVLDGSMLIGALKDERNIRIELQSKEVDEIGKLMGLFDNQFALSLIYKVGPIPVKSNRTVSRTLVKEKIITLDQQ